MFNFFKGLEQASQSEQPREAKKEEEKKKNGFFRKLGLAASLAAALTAMTEGTALSQDKKRAPEKMGREEFEAVIKQNALTEKEILEQLKIKGREGRLNNTPVKKLETPDGKIIIVGYNEKGEAKWLIQENGDASMRMIDYNVNGTAERVIINNEKGPKNRKSADNDLNSFSGIEYLATQARISSDLKPEDIQVNSFVIEDEKRILRTVDFKTGEAGETVDEAEVSRVDEKTQTVFGKKLNQIKSEVEKTK